MKSDWSRRRRHGNADVDLWLQLLFYYICSKHFLAWFVFYQVLVLYWASQTIWILFLDAALGLKPFNFILSFIWRCCKSKLRFFLESFVDYTSNIKLPKYGECKACCIGDENHRIVVAIEEANEVIDSGWFAHGSAEGAGSILDSFIAIEDSILWHWGLTRPHFFL